MDVYLTQLLMQLQLQLSARQLDEHPSIDNQRVTPPRLCVNHMQTIKISRAVAWTKDTNFTMSEDDYIMILFNLI